MQVTTLAATDFDEGSNSDLTYTLAPDVPGAVFPFQIDGQKSHYRFVDSDNILI